MLLDLGNCRSLHDLAKSIKSDGFRGELAHIVSKWHLMKSVCAHFVCLQDLANALSECL